jgi:hypothetical protein
VERLALTLWLGLSPVRFLAVWCRNVLQNGSQQTDQRGKDQAMADAEPAIIRVGGWSWQVNKEAQSLSFLGGEDSFTFAVNALTDLSEQHTRNLAVLVEYIENMDDGVLAGGEVPTRPSAN